METIHRVGVVIGSLRRGAYSRRVAEALIGLAPPSLALEVIEIGGLPLYDPDLDDGVTPYAWAQFRNAVARVGALLFVTPEYNRSMPAPLKNALDVGSRPYGSNVWGGKPGAIVSISPGGIGGFGANHHLRQSLVFLDVPAMQQPEAYLGHVDTLLGATGTPIDEPTRLFLGKFMESFAHWVATNARS